MGNSENGIGCFVILIFVLIGMFIGGACIDYTVSTWLVYAGKPNNFYYWHGCLLGMVPGVGQLAIPAAAITWILTFFI